MKSRKNRRTLHVARIGERNEIRVLVGIPEAKKTTEKRMRRCEECVKMHHKDSDGGCGLKSYGAGYGTVAGCSEHDNEPSVSAIYGKYFDFTEDIPLCL